MSGWTETDRQIAKFSATAVVAIVAVYITTGFVGVVGRPRESRALLQVDPYLAVMEYLIILAAVALVVLMVGIYTYAPPKRKIYALAALCFMIIFAVLTCSLHFASLTVLRRVASEFAPLLSRHFSFIGGGEWPTLALALDLLAWDLFFGLSMLFAAHAFGGDRLQNTVRASMTLSGTLCVVAVLGPVLGDMRIQWLGILGYAFVLPVACIFLAVLFARTPAELP
ncbi:MAG TPA: hypothetical protein VKH45_04205 [Candidatus Acidoferrum sp.]|nr:hypothetical protein [Candidatus Acidoferrum sp.]